MSNSATVKKIRHLFDHKSDKAAETTESTATDSTVALKNGPGAAAILASGIGTALFGLMVFLAETFPAVKEVFKLSDAVSGKTTFGIALWLASWGILHYLWRNKDVPFGKAMIATTVAIVIGLALTFPPVFLLFAAE